MRNGNCIEFLKKLNHPEPEVKIEAILELGKCDDVQIFKIMSRHFSHGHPRVRETLFNVFTAQKDRRIAEVVADTLHSPLLSVKSLAMEILKEMGSEALYPLKRLTKSENPELRKIAAELLGDIADDSSPAILMDLLNDDSELVIFAAIEGLGKHNEIQAVPRLLEFYEKLKKRRPVILNTLGKIFLHWEKYILRSELLETDPILAFSLVNSVQENSNVSALNLMIHWLQSDKLEIRDEVLKAIASILENNPYVTLPIFLLETIEATWKQHAGKLPSSAYLICLSRLPASNALENLVRFYEKSPDDPVVKNALVEFVLRFQAIFFGRYFQFSPRVRQSLIQFLTAEKVVIHEKQLVQLCAESRDKAEQHHLLELAVRNKIPEAKQFLLVNLNEISNEQLAQSLRQLQYYQDESLWPLYLKYAGHSDKAVQKLAYKGLLAFPVKTFQYLLQISSKKDSRQTSFFLPLLMELPADLASRIFDIWLLKPTKSKMELLKKYFEESGETHYLPLVARALSAHPESVDSLFGSLVAAEVTPAFATETDGFWSLFSAQEQKETTQLLKKYWYEEIEDLPLPAEKENQAFSTEAQEFEEVNALQNLNGFEEKTS